MCSEYTDSCNGWSSFPMGFTDTMGQQRNAEIQETWALFELFREVFYILYFQFHPHHTTSVLSQPICWSPVSMHVDLSSLVPSMFLILPSPVFLYPASLPFILMESH